ncbi:MAG: ThuA domain-containing protein [Verrucomicrobiales bacterium]|nr:ThuA domain-containing protein [Verrucomicrobiales bacterium]
MKTYHALLTLAVTLSLTLGSQLSLTAQNKKPKTWEEQKAERLKPVTNEEKEKIAKSIPNQLTSATEKKRKLLIFYRCEGFVHPAISTANYAIPEMGKKTGSFTADVSDDYSVFTQDNLKQYDAILFNSTTHLKFPDPQQRAAILDFIKAGKGIVGIHAAGDCFHNWKEGAALMGGLFSGHPWTAGGTWAFRLDEPKHVLNQAFNGKGFWHQDEIYQYQPTTFAGPENLRIIVSLDMSKKIVSEKLADPKYANHNKAFKPGKREVPVTWLREYGKGRLFYTNFGHNKQTYWSPTVMQHYLDGLQYAFGDLPADATPSAKANKVTPALAPEKP